MKEKKIESNMNRTYFLLRKLRAANLPLLKYQNNTLIFMFAQCINSIKVPYFSIDNAHLMYNAHTKLFTLYF